jgi:hypothetical protein
MLIGRLDRLLTRLMMIVVSAHAMGLHVSSADACCWTRACQGCMWRQILHDPHASHRFWVQNSWFALICELGGDCGACQPLLSDWPCRPDICQQCRAAAQQHVCSNCVMRGFQTSAINFFNLNLSCWVQCPACTISMPLEGWPCQCSLGLFLPPCQSCLAAVSVG